MFRGETLVYFATVGAVGYVGYTLAKSGELGPEMQQIAHNLCVQLFGTAKCGSAPVLPPPNGGPTDPCRALYSEQFCYMQRLIPDIRDRMLGYMSYRYSLGMDPCDWYGFNAGLALENLPTFSTPPPEWWEWCDALR